MDISRQEYPTYDSNDLKELEFKRLASQGRSDSCYNLRGDWNGFQSNDAGTMWTPTDCSGYIWRGTASEQEASVLAQQTSCQRCGAHDASAAGDFDPANGLWYCSACWRLSQLINALSSDEEDSDDDDNDDDVDDDILRKLAACKGRHGHKSDNEDGVSTVGSTQADIPSSGESDAEGNSERVPAQMPWNRRPITMQPSEQSWAAQMRLRREQGAVTRRPERAPLQPSATSWAAQMQLRRLKKSGSPDVDTKSPEDISRSTRALLNKLTVERFESLAAQVISLIGSKCDTQEHLDALVAEIFAKATTDHAFCPLYADLCARLDAHLNQKELVIGGSVFRTALQKECQATYERDLRGSRDRDLLDGLQGDARYEMEVKLKCSRIGNLRLIGELLLRKLLTTRVVLVIAQELLNITGDGGVATESLVALLQVISPEFGSFDSSFANALKDIYVPLQRRTKDGKLSPRIQFLIRDLCDALPKECWVQTPTPVRNQLRTPRRSGAAVWRPKH